MTQIPQVVECSMVAKESYEQIEVQNQLEIRHEGNFIFTQTCLRRIYKNKEQ